MKLPYPTAELSLKPELIYYNSKDYLNSIKTNVVMANSQDCCEEACNYAMNVCMRCASSIFPPCQECCHAAYEDCMAMCSEC